MAATRFGSVPRPTLRATSPAFPGFAPVVPINASLPASAARRFTRFGVFFFTRFMIGWPEYHTREMPGLYEMPVRGGYERFSRRSISPRTLFAVRVDRTADHNQILGPLAATPGF